MPMGSRGMAGGVLTIAESITRMKILQVKTLAIPEVRVVRLGRFRDARGYFTEPFRRGDVQTHPELAFLARYEFPQMNENWSRPGVIRGLHFQWSPYMGKFVRTVAGHMVDLVLDIRLDSPTLGKILAYDMPVSPEADWLEWIWVPPGFAHGNFFAAETCIQYLCTSEYSPRTEAGICPLSGDLDWSLCDRPLKQAFDKVVAGGAILSDKDRAGLGLQAWLADERAKQFRYGVLSADA